MINVSKCIGCWKGICSFVKQDDGFSHLDLFATREAGAIYHCENSDTVGKFLKENDNKGGIYAPTKELEEVLNKQAYWSEDIISLATEIFKETEKVSNFFQQGEKDNFMWNKPILELEDTLLSIAEKEGIEVTKEDYPSLLKWQ